MKTMLKTLVGGLTVLLMAVSMQAGEGNEGQADQAKRIEVRKAVREFRQAQMEKIKAAREEGQAARKKVLEGLKEKEPAEAVATLKSHCESAYARRSEFRNTLYAERVEFSNSLAKTYDIDEEKVAERQAAAAERHEKVTAHFKTQHTENLAVLDKLAATEGLTRETLRETLKSHMETQRSENRELMQGIRPEGRPGKGVGEAKGRRNRPEK